MTIAPKAKFIAITSCDRGLNALDVDGDVWVYCGRDKGFTMLNMTRMPAERVLPRREDRPAWAGENESPF